MAHGPTIEINLGALVRNYQWLAAKHVQRRCGAVVKANAYGLGVAEVVKALHGAGCREFFVATLEEGAELRGIVSRYQLAVDNIYVFHGARKGELKDFLAHGLTPVLNSMEQWQHWEKSQPCALHVDTGMTRLGLDLDEALALQPAACNLRHILSHLACAGGRDNPMNRQQLEKFQKARAHFSEVPASFANSSGILLGKEFHFDLLRPGCALYGISPLGVHNNPVEHVATLTAPVLQIRTLTQEAPVSYGGRAHAKAGATLATVELGYADGFHRCLTGHAFGFAHGVKLPVLGRVTMDMVVLDISALPAHLHTPDLRVTFIGEEQKVDVLAKAAGTIGYEIFTSLGRRVKRIFLATS